jgi:hypothetical protein
MAANYDTDLTTGKEAVKLLLTRQSILGSIQLPDWMSREL